MDDAAKRRSSKVAPGARHRRLDYRAFPGRTAEYQIYGFNSQAGPMQPGTRGKWLRVADIAELNKTIDAMRQIVPDGGSSLERAFMAISTLSPRPDNVYLITDGLPTMGLDARAKKRHRHRASAPAVCLKRQ